MKTAFLSKTKLRKTLLSLSIIGASTLALSLPTISTAAVPAQQQTQVPGYYRMALGDFEVTAVYDGYINLGTNLLKDISEKDIQTLLSSMFIDSTNGVQTAVNAFVINTGTHLVLVDAGAAQCFGPTLGVVVDNIRAAGYQPEQIDTVLLTHLHPDHACGINNQGKAVFPNATVYVSKEDADFWLNKDIASKAPPEHRPMFEKSMESVAPYQANDKLKIYTAGETLLPGVKVVPTPGHTPGHTSYLFSSKGDNLLVWGDIVHSHSIQFAHPNVSLEFDSDSKQAIATRKAIFAEAAKDKLWVAGAHLPFPGLGHVRANKVGYTWVPVEYSPLIEKK